LYLVQLGEEMEIQPHGILTEIHGTVSPFAHFGPRTGILVRTEYRLAAIFRRKPVY